jgi:CRISPR/Cas system-associated exonuclease Cas4 (RecB family)
MIVVKSLSFSTVSQYVNCSMRVWYEKIDQLPKRGGMTRKMLFGIALHSAVASYFRGILNNMEMDLDQLVRVFRIRYEAWPGNDPLKNKQSIDVLCSEAKSLLEMFLRSDLPRTIIAVERPIQYALTSQLQSVGQIDLLARDDDGVLNIIELKSSSKKPTPDQILKYEEQCLVYAMGFKEPVKAKAWLFLRRKKSPAFETLDLDINKIDYDEVIDKFTSVARSISNGIHFRNRTWQCNNCPYNYMCFRKPVEVEQKYREAA